MMRLPILQLICLLCFGRQHWAVEGFKFRKAIFDLTRTNERLTKTKSAQTIAIASLLSLGVLFDGQVPVMAVDKGVAPLIYKSGKSPVPNKDPNDKTGTKKDINFLRCISNCKSRCQLPTEGLAKTDCIQDCQDQCCTTYEQCSFKIKTNTGNSI
jgi:hypothetical protein